MREHLSRFKYAHLFAAQIRLKEGCGKEEGKALFAAAKLKLDEMLLNYEAINKGCIAIFPGSCMLCEECARADGLPCIHPERVRLSIDAYSLDITSITKDIFNIDLRWYEDTPPEYYTLIGAVLSEVSPLRQI
jgi:predicted metal-binding protein